MFLFLLFLHPAQPFGGRRVPGKYRPGLLFNFYWDIATTNKYTQTEITEHLYSLNSR